MAKTAHELRLEYPTQAAFQRDYDDNLRKGRAFVPGAVATRERELCSVVIVHPDTGETLALDAEVVWIKQDEPGAGVGVQLRELNEVVRGRLGDFVARAAAAASPASPQEESLAEESDEEDGGPAARNVYERVRAMTLRERDTTARQGRLPERVALERCYGSSVWESLLQNPLLTPPEVARVAKNGSLPRPLVHIIVSNAGWLSSSEIQRALLGNPRVSGTDLDKLLRTMPRASLDRVAATNAYRAEVRQAAKKLLGRA
jgi:hypothetical protein